MDPTTNAAVELEETLETEPSSATAIKSLEKTAVRGAFWSIIEYGTSMALRVVSSLVLTHILAPEAMGAMILVNTFVFGINLLSDIGLTPSVIQSKRGDEPLFLNTAWSIQALRGVVLWVIALIITWPAAAFYHQPQLRSLLPVLALGTLISGFNSTNLLSLARHLGVRRLFAIDVSANVVSLVVTIFIAKFVSPSVWAIVIGQVASALYKLALSHVNAAAPGIRNHLAWDKDAVQEIIHFGRWILIATAFYFGASQADKLILGKLTTLTMLGIYGLAYQLSDIPRQVIMALSQRVAYPFIAKIIHLQPEEFRARFLRYRFYGLMAGAFLLTIMVTWGHLLIKYLYDKRYQEGQWMIPILALGLWQTLMYSTTLPALFSMGKSKYGAFGNAAWCATVFIATPIAFHFYGIHGAVWAVSFADVGNLLVFEIGAHFEGIRPLKQDFLTTAAFAGMLAIFHVIAHGFRF